MIEKENRMFEQFLKRLDPKDFQLKGNTSSPIILFNCHTLFLMYCSHSNNTLISDGHAEEESEN